VAGWLGHAAVDPDRLAAVTAAANGWCRLARSYYSAYATDTDDVAPTDPCHEAVVMYAGRLYRHRGVVDGSATYPSGGDLTDVWAAGADIRRLLGVPRAQAV